MIDTTLASLGCQQTAFYMGLLLGCFVLQGIGAGVTLMAAQRVTERRPMDPRIVKGAQMLLVCSILSPVMVLAAGTSF